MAGIAGKVVFGRDAQPPRDVVCAMTGALAHRGPDGAGVHDGPRFALGYRRLDAGGPAGERQPLGSADGTVWAAYDGEIVNARDLRRELRARGRVFETTSDAEVVVQGYKEWSDGVVERLRGAFALAVWDSVRSRLVLARDRLGIRPLCYAAVEGHGVTFASEAAALLHDPRIPREWDPASVREYLALGYVPSPATIFRRVVKLPPGHVLTAEHDRVKVTRYWDVTFAEAASRRSERTSEGEYVERLEDLLGQVVRLHATAAPSVVLLSPDVGSAALLAGLDAAHAGAAAAVTVSFDGPRSRVADRSRTIARHFHFRHHAEVVALRLTDVVSRLAASFDEPLADASAVKSYAVAMAGQAYAGVVLSAAGADEIWAGHASYRAEQVEARVRRMLGPVSTGIGLVGRAMPLPFDVVRAAGHLALPPSDARARYRTASHEPSRTDRLCNRGFLHETRGVDPFLSLRETHAACGSRDGLTQALYLDQKTRLVDDVLTRLDRTGAAAGVEMRLPMLDHELVEFANRVPSPLKLRRDKTHYLLRRLLDGRVPARLFGGREEPFEARAGAWLRGPLASMASDVLLSGRFRQRGIFDSRAVTRAWQAHLTGRRDHHRELWSLLMLELWFQRFVDAVETRARVA